MDKITIYFSRIKEELLKVIFPTKIQVKQAFFAVFLVVLIISIFLAIVDFLMSNVIKIFI